LLAQDLAHKGLGSRFVPGWLSDVPRIAQILAEIDLFDNSRSDHEWGELLRQTLVEHLAK
jgi:hypothetical protein